jgi:hypothetical protein
MRERKSYDPTLTEDLGRYMLSISKTGLLPENRQILLGEIGRLKQLREEGKFEADLKDRDIVRIAAFNVGLFSAKTEKET